MKSAGKSLTPQPAAKESLTASLPIAGATAARHPSAAVPQPRANRTFAKVLCLARAPRADASLRVSSPHDPEEREAERVADEVMRMPLTAPAARVEGHARRPTVHRQETPDESEAGVASESFQGLCVRTFLPPGQVRFEGFTDDQLSDFAVIPENGRRTRTPENGVWYDSDGFWMKGRACTEWFKVPSHCDATIRPGPGGFSPEYCCNWAASFVKGRPRWTTDDHGSINVFCINDLPGPPQEGEPSMFASLMRTPIVASVGFVQRKCAACEEEEVQRQETGPGPETTPALVNQVLQSAGQPLDTATRAFFEPRFATDFSNVRIHTNASAAESAQAVQARAYTHGQSIVFNAGEFSPGTSAGKHLLAHELTHVVQQSTDRSQAYDVRRNCDPSVASCVPEPPVSGPESPAEASTTANLEDSRQQYQTALDQLLEQGPECDPASSAYKQYCRACETLTSEGETPLDEPEGVLIPGDQFLVVDDGGRVQFLDADEPVALGDDVFPMLEELADASQGDEWPSFTTGGPLNQILLWSDGRTLLTPPVSADFATLVVQGTPGDYESGGIVPQLGTPWKSVRDAGVHSLLTSGLYQLGSHPISRFNGVNMPAGSRIKFADPLRSLKGITETRLITIFEPGTKRFYAWDGHKPMGKVVHDFYHIHQKGNMGSLFGQPGGTKKHLPMRPNQLAQARGLRFIKYGGRVMVIAGVLTDGYFLYESAMQSIERGTPKPVVAQAVRTIGGWAGGWAGAKIGCAAGAAAGVETGPGLVLTCIAGGIIVGFAGYYGADWVADMISED